MPVKQALLFIIIISLSFFTASCALMYKDDPEFDESRVPGDYEGLIACSYDPCEVAGETTYTITKSDSYFILHFEDSVSSHIPDLEFSVELDGESFGEAVTISGFIKLMEGQPYELTPYDQHFFHYWTYYDTRQEGERFEMRIYEPGTDNNPPDMEYLQLTGHKGIQ